MRQLMFATAAVISLGGQAFAGGHSQPTPPAPPNVAPVNITVKTSDTTTGGGSVSTTIHAGSITYSESVSEKVTILVGASISVSTQGYTVP